MVELCERLSDLTDGQVGGQGSRIVLMGNSIGGFTATAAAAALERSKDTSISCSGLVLCNSAGRLVESTEYDSTEDSNEYLYPPYSGPPSTLSRLFGKGIIAALQPQITPLVQWLYPQVPTRPLDKNLPQAILRDSCDPGAADIIAAGAKLPKPRSVNGLLSEYTGPVLVTQGGLDPLNDAKKRAMAYKNTREGIDVDILELGHCAMDEDPIAVGNCILRWAAKSGITA